MTIENGNVISAHYKGTLDSGEEFDSSYSRDEPITFTVGEGQVIPGFDTAVVGMLVGEVKTISLTPDEAYGEAVPDRIHEVPLEMLPKDFVVTDGAVVHAQNDSGTFAGIVSAHTDTDATIDFNHPLAGKNLNFEIELVSVEEK
jgi:peptidylprolyl isomerase